MGRWSELAGRLDDADSDVAVRDTDSDPDDDRAAVDPAAADRPAADERDPEGPPALEEFLDDNHQLFTTIGVFGALAVYLIEFQGATSAGIGGPVGAVLLLFLLTSFAAIRNAYRCTGRARRHGAYLLVFGYAVFMYSFVTLAVSVVLVIGGRYATGAQNVLSSSFVYGLVFLYVPVAFRADLFGEFDGAGLVGVAGRHAPHISAGLLAAWYVVEFRGGSLAPDLDSAGYAIGVVLSLVGNHLAITAGVFGAAWLLDRVVSWSRA